MSASVSSPKKNGDLKILHFVESYGGGVATAVQQYRTHKSLSTSLLARVRKGDLNPADSPISSSSFMTRSLIGLISKWLRIRNANFDIIHAHSTVAGLIARLLPPKRGKVVYSPHAFIFKRPMNRLFRELSFYVEKILLSRTGSGVAVSLDEFNSFLDLGYSAKSIFVVPHYVKKIECVRLYPNEIIFVAIGRICFQKNPEAFVEFKANWESKFSETPRWIWIGDGEKVTREKLVSSGIEVTGWLPRAEVTALLGDATILFHPARYEGLPMAIIEAMSHGVPVVASDIAPHAEIEGVITYKDIDDAAQLAHQLLDYQMWPKQSSVVSSSIDKHFSQRQQELALSKAYLACFPGIDRNE